MSAILAASPPNSVSADEVLAASWQGTAQIFDLLIGHGGLAHTCQVHPETGDTLLHEAAHRGNTEVCLRLVALGVDPAQRSLRTGCTAAEAAMILEWDNTAKALDPGIVIPNPRPPLLYWGAEPPKLTYAAAPTKLPAVKPPASASQPAACTPAPSKAAAAAPTLGLRKFTAAFAKEDIDLAVAKTMSEAEFEQLGLTLGARKKLGDPSALSAALAPVRTLPSCVLLCVPLLIASRQRRPPHLRLCPRNALRWQCRRRSLL